MVLKDVWRPSFFFQALVDVKNQKREPPRVNTRGAEGTTAPKKKPPFDAFQAARADGVWDKTRTAERDERVRRSPK